MFVLDKGTNKIIKVESKTFHDFGFNERDNLQEWIANYPECLGENSLLFKKNLMVSMIQMSVLIYLL